MQSSLQDQTVFSSHIHTTYTLVWFRLQYVWARACASRAAAVQADNPRPPRIAA